MKRLLLAALLASVAVPALAQNTTCSTRPPGDNSNACASTAFVTTAVGSVSGGGTIPALPATHIFVGNASNVAADYGAAATLQPNGDVNLSGTLTVGTPFGGGASLATLSVFAPGINLIQPFAGTSVQVTGPTTQPTFVVMDGLNNTGQGVILVARYARGTPAQPLGVLSGDALFSLLVRGYPGVVPYQGGGAILVSASEDFDRTHNGSRLDIYTTPLGLTATVDVARFHPSGGLSIGQPNIFTDPGNGNIVSTGLTLAGITGATQCLQVNPAGTVGGTGLSCGVQSLLHSHILVGSAAGIATDFGTLATFNDFGLLNITINPGGAGQFYNIMTSTTPLNTARIGWRLTDGVADTVDFGLTGTGSPAPFTGRGFITSTRDFVIDVNTPSAILFGIGEVEAGRWDQNGHLQLTYLAGGGNQCLTVNGAGVVAGTGASCGGGGGGGGTPGGSNTQVQYNSLGSFAGAAGVTTNGTALAIGAALTPDAPLTINVNTTALPAGLAIGGMALHIGGADGANTNVILDTFSNAGMLVFRSAAGSLAARTPTVSTTLMAIISAAGYAGSGQYAQGLPQVQFWSAENYTLGAQGNYIQFNTVAVGTNTNKESARVQPSGGFSVGASNALPDPGVGIIRSTGLILSGITGSVQCLHVNTTGAVSGTGSDCGSGGGGGTPGGATTQVQYNNAGVFAGATGVTTNGTALAIGAAVAPDALLTINANTGTTPVAPYTSAAFHIVGADTTFPSVTFDTFGNPVGGGIFLRQANGTRAAPTPTLQNQILGFIQANGYLGGSAYAVGAAQIAFASDEDFSSSKNGAKINFYTTARGTNAAVVGLTIQSSGGLSVGNANAPFDPGAGIVLATGARFTGGSTTGATRCLHVDTAGNVSGTASDCGATAVGGGVTGVTSPNGTLTVGGTTGITVDLNLAHSNTWTANQGISASSVAPDAPLTINANTAATVAPSVGTNVHLVGADGATNIVGFDSFGAGNQFGFRSAGGTLAAKTGLGVSFSIVALQAQSWDGASYNPIATQQFLTAEAQDATHHGSSIVWRVTPNGTSAGTLEAMRLSGVGLNIAPANTGAAALGDAPLTVNANTVSSPARSNPVAVHVIGADNAYTSVEINAFGSTGFGPVLTGTSTGGTAAAKTKSLAGSLLLGINANGYNGTAYSHSTAAIFFQAAEDYTAAAEGSNIMIQTTPKSSIVASNNFIFWGSGGLSVGAPNLGADPGVGGIQATRAVLTSTVAVNNLTLNGSTQPGMTFIPSSGATLNGQLFQQANTIYFGTGGVGYWFGVDQNSGAFGYALASPGAGGTVTQSAVNAPVSINKPTGVITLASAAGTSTWQFFNVNNSIVNPNDTIILSPISGSNQYLVTATVVRGAIFTIGYVAVAGTTVEAPQFQFNVIRGTFH